MRTRYILPILIVMLVAGVGCNKGANQWGDLESDSTDLSEGATTDVEDGEVSVSFLLPNGEEVGSDSQRISRHAKIKVEFNGERPECKLMWKDSEVPVDIVSESESEQVLKPKKPLHNGEYSACGTTFTTKAAGDLNADGFSDIAIGGPRGFQDQGVAFIYLGKENPAWQSYLNADVTIQSTAPDGRLGDALAVGDLNGDGVDDVAIGAPEDSSSQTPRGAVYVFYGRDSWNQNYGTISANATMRRINGEESQFGNALAMGDLNGDGFDDLIVGEQRAHGYDNMGGLVTLSGAVHVFFGSKEGLAQERLLTASEQGDVVFSPNAVPIMRREAAGTSVASGDINADGIDDLIIGSLVDVPSNNPDKVYLILGGANLVSKGGDESLSDSSKVDRTITVMGSDELGVSVAAFPLTPEKDGILMGAKGLAFSYQYEEGNPLGLIDQLGVGTFPPLNSSIVVGWLEVGFGVGAPAESIFYYSDYPPQDWQMRPQGQGAPPPTRLGCSMSSLGDIDANGTPDFAYGECEATTPSGFSPPPQGGVVHVILNGTDIPISGTSNMAIREQFGSAIAGGRIR